MGQSLSLKEVPNFAPTRIRLLESVKHLIDHQQITFTQYSCLSQIKTILQQLYFNPICQIDQNSQTTKYHLSRMMMVIYSNRRFGYLTIKILMLLLKTINSIVNFHSLLIVHIDDWKLGMYVAKFLLVLTDINSIKKFDQMYHLKQMGQLDQQTEQAVQRAQSVIGAHKNGNIIAKLQQVEARKIQITIRNSLNATIKLRQKVFTRSKQTFEIINQYEQSCFLILSKVYLCERFNRILYEANAKDSEVMKSYLLIGAFFLVQGLQHNKVSLYQSAVVLLLSFYEMIQDGKQKDDKGDQMGSNQSYSHNLPSYLFKNVPLCPSTQVDQFILYYTLFALKQRTIHFNRILSLKLAKNIIKSKKIYLVEIEEFLVAICQQVKIQTIQRAYVSQLVACYLQDHQLSSSAKYLQKIAGLNQISYSIKVKANKKLQLSAQSVLQSLYNNRIQTYQLQISNACERYIYEHISSNIGKNKIRFAINDQELWKTIIPKQSLIFRNSFDHDAQNDNQNPSICQNLQRMDASLAEYRDEYQCESDQESNQNRFDSMQVLAKQSKQKSSKKINKEDNKKQKVRKVETKKLQVKVNDFRDDKQQSAQEYAKTYELMLQSEKFRDKQQFSMNVPRKVCNGLDERQISF